MGEFIFLMCFIWLVIVVIGHRASIKGLKKDVETLRATLLSLQADTPQTDTLQADAAAAVPAPETLPPDHTSHNKDTVLLAEETSPSPKHAVEEPTLPTAVPTQSCATSGAQDQKDGELSAPLATAAQSPADHHTESPQPPTGPLHVIWQWLRANPLLYTGLAFFITGITFAITYLAKRGFLSLTLAGIALVGVATILAGYRLSLRNRVYGCGVMGGGAAILYLVLFSGAKWDLIPVGMALATMLLLTAAVTALAVAINLEMLAVMSSLGGFMAPVLLATGSGNYVGLFSFYVLLCAGNVALLRYRAWDIPILLSYVMTVGVGFFWGAHSYEPFMRLHIQLFAIVFFILFNVATLLLCLHTDKVPAKAQGKRNLIHASLLFGVPLIFFGIHYVLLRGIPYALAQCALGMTAWYLGLAKFSMRHEGAGISLVRDAALILALGFSAVAVPLAFNPTWTLSVWAIQGVGMLWMGIRQNYPFARMCGYIMQVLAAIAYIQSLNKNILPFDSLFAASSPALWWQWVLSSLLLAAAGTGVLALCVRHGLHTERGSLGPRNPHEAPAQPSADDALPHSMAISARFMLNNEYRLFPLWQLWVLLWFYVAATDCLNYFWGDSRDFGYMLLLLCSLSALGWQWLARRFAMPLWIVPSYVVLPLLVWAHSSVLSNVFELLTDMYAFRVNGLWFMHWPSAISLWAGAAVLVLSFRNNALNALPLRPWALRLFTVYLLCAVYNTAFFPVVILGHTPMGATLPFALFMALTSLLLLQPAWEAPALRRLHCVISVDDLRTGSHTASVFVAIAAGLLFLHLCYYPGLGPSPYIPMLSLTDMTQILALGTLTAVFRSIPASNISLRNFCRQALAVAALVVATLSLARAVCWYTALPYRADFLKAFPLFLVAQTLLWGSIALVLIVLASRRFGSRTLWLAGATLLGLTLLKMLVLDMAERDTWARVISFMFTGLLMLIMGYYCPMPPQGRCARPESTPPADQSPL